MTLPEAFPVPAQFGKHCVFRSNHMHQLSIKARQRYCNFPVQFGGSMWIHHGEKIRIYSQVFDG